MAKKYLKDENKMVRAITTSNLDLEKPLTTDNYDINVFNRNMDKIDAKVKDVENKANEALQAGVNAKTGMKEAINSKITVPDVSDEDGWDTYIQRVNDIKEGRGNAVVGDVLSGKTFTNDSGQMLTGTMPNRGGAQTITPGTSNKVLNSGYYSGDITVKGDANLKEENIKKGISVFGKNGTYNPQPKSASGTQKISGTVERVKINISNLNFTPRTVVIKTEWYSSTVGLTYYGYVVLTPGLKTIYVYNRDDRLTKIESGEYMSTGIVIKSGGFTTDFKNFIHYNAQPNATYSWYAYE